MVDFSKAPEGATHYSPESRMMHVVWYKEVNANSHEANCDMDEDYSGWITYTANDFQFNIHRKIMKPIPLIFDIKNLTITCDDERQKMLCEQVIRMCRGEDSQYLYDGVWADLPDDISHIHKAFAAGDFRAKPKKELVVPWEFISDCVDEITVSSDGDITFSAGYSLMLKLDLTDIELPVTVKRPEGK